MDSFPTRHPWEPWSQTIFFWGSLKPIIFPMGSWGSKGGNSDLQLANFVTLDPRVEGFNFEFNEKKAARFFRSTSMKL